MGPRCVNRRVRTFVKAPVDVDRDIEVGSVLAMSKVWSKLRPGFGASPFARCVQAARGLPSCGWLACPRSVRPASPDRVRSEGGPGWSCVRLVGGHTPLQVALCATFGGPDWSESNAADRSARFPFRGTCKGVFPPTVFAHDLPGPACGVTRSGAGGWPARRLDDHTPSDGNSGSPALAEAERKVKRRLPRASDRDDEHDMFPCVRRRLIRDEIVR